MKNLNLPVERSKVNVMSTTTTMINIVKTCGFQCWINKVVDVAAATDLTLHKGPALVKKIEKTKKKKGNGLFETGILVVFWKSLLERLQASSLFKQKSKISTIFRRCAFLAGILKNFRDQFNKFESATQKLTQVQHCNQKDKEELFKIGTALRM